MPSARDLDQFFTARPIAQQCWDFLAKTGLLREGDSLLEPSAGDGAFFELLPASQRIGLDIDPRHAEVLQQDFLTWQCPPPAEGARWVVVGNPPFGKNGSLALSFFNKAASFAEVIAFVLPLSFRKRSVQRRMNDWFHLLEDLELADSSFVFGGERRSVPCCFQIWVRKDQRRENKPHVITHPDFQFCKNKQDAHFAIRRVGRRAGSVVRDFQDYAQTSHYFIRAKDCPQTLIARFEAMDWSSTKRQTVGPYSVCKEELVQRYAEATIILTDKEKPRPD